MSENEPRPPENPYGSQPPTNPYGQPVPTSSDQPPTESSPGWHPPQSPQGGYPPQSPQGGYPPAPYGHPQPRGAERPTTVTAAAWITIVMSALSALLFIFVSLVAVLAQDLMTREIRRQPGFEDLGVDPGSVIGIVVAVMIVFALWSVIGIALGVFVLKRSNLARILLVISSAAVALISLASIASGASALPLVAAVAVVVLLFVGGASEWFARRDSAPYGGPPYS